MDQLSGYSGTTGIKPITVHEVLQQGKVHAVVNGSDGFHLAIISDKFIDHAMFGHFAGHVARLYEAIILSKIKLTQG